MKREKIAEFLRLPKRKTATPKPSKGYYEKHQNAMMFLSSRENHDLDNMINTTKKVISKK